MIDPKSSTVDEGDEVALRRAFRRNMLLLAGIVLLIGAGIWRGVVMFGQDNERDAAADMRMRQAQLADCKATHPDNADVACTAYIERATQKSAQ